MKLGSGPMGPWPLASGPLQWFVAQVPWRKPHPWYSAMVYCLWAIAVGQRGFKKMLGVQLAKQGCYQELPFC
jgi:hypothetical protein